MDQKPYWFTVKFMAQFRQWFAGNILTFAGGSLSLWIGTAFITQLLLAIKWLSVLGTWLFGAQF